MEYKEKLIQFNATDKYQEEMDFMISMIDPQSKDKIIDYGCGTGYMVKYILENFEGIKCFGFDVQNLRTGDDAKDEYTFKREFHIQMNKVYFMHSIAHIPDLQVVLRQLHDTFLEDGAEIHVLTPNKTYLDRCNNDNYLADPTVIRHYHMDELTNLFAINGFDIVKTQQIGEAIGVSQERLYLKVKRI